MNNIMYIIHIFFNLKMVRPNDNSNSTFSLICSEAIFLNWRSSDWYKARLAIGSNDCNVTISVGQSNPKVSTEYW